MSIHEALSTDRDMQSIIRDASLADIVADLKSGVFADPSRYPDQQVRKLMPQNKDGDRVIVAFAKITDAEDMKRYSFWHDRKLLEEKGRENLTVAHILAIRSGENGWSSGNPFILKMPAQGVPNPSLGWDAGLPENISAFKKGDTVAHTLARFSRRWFLPVELLTDLWLVNLSGETVLDALTSSMGFSVPQQTRFETILRSSATAEEVLDLLTTDTLNKLNSRPAFKKFLIEYEINLLNPETRETSKVVIRDLLKQRGVGGHEVVGSLSDMIQKNQVQDLAEYYRDNIDDPVVLSDEAKILAVKNDTTSVAHEVAKVIDKSDQAVVERPWMYDASVLGDKDTKGLTVAHWLAIGSLSSGWGVKLTPSVYALSSDYQGPITPNVKELGDVKDVQVAAGDSVAHYMARFNPEWTTEDESILELRNSRNETVSEVLRLRSGEATPLKELTPDELQAFRARFKRLQYDAMELARTFRWLYLAEFENAEIEIERKGNYIIWKNGTWLDGEWLVGKWLNGTFKDGVWRSGNWQDGVWENGFWHDGEWDNGTWKSGKWLDGTWHNGVWEGGIFQEGIWKNGEWKDGTWGHGVWLEGSYKGKKRQAGVWAGDVWERDTSSYQKPKKTGKFTAYQLIGRFKSINGVRVPDMENPNADEGTVGQLIKQIATMIDARHFPWLAYMDTEYENAEVSFGMKGDSSGALRWLGGNWNSGKWDVDAVWMPKARGKFTGRDALGHYRNVPPIPENAAVWKEIPVLTEEMLKDKTWLKQRQALLLKKGAQGVKKAQAADKVDKKPVSNVATALANAGNANTMNPSSQAPGNPVKGDKAVPTKMSGKQ